MKIITRNLVVRGLWIAIAIHVHSLLNRKQLNEQTPDEFSDAT